MPYSLTSLAFSLRIAALSFGGGIAVLLLASLFHPGDAPAHVSHLAFAEYAQSAAWTDAHVGQFLGILLILLGFAGLRERLRTDAPLAAALSTPAMMAAVATLSVAAVLQAVDGPALRHVVVAWHDAPAAASDPALRVAEAVRWIEIGLNSYLRILLGLTLALFGAALATSRLFPRWLGWLGLAGGAGSALQGLYVGHFGFDASVIPAIALPSLVYFAWFMAMAVILWRDGVQMARGAGPSAAGDAFLAVGE